jgi:hypothetical protein
MKSIFDIRTQKLFLVALVLKTCFSFLGWWLRDPWVLGFTVPLLIMTAYIVLGLYRRDLEVTDEKFADTCYYLGFIFTITSIIFSLFDLPHIGTRIQDIAVRFGAAMVSTVLGLGVRVYLVSFRKDAADAIKQTEDSLIDAARKFTQQLSISLERLQVFETQVDAASRTSVERVNIQVDNLSKNHAEKLNSFFIALTESNREAFNAAISEVNAASQKLAESVNSYSGGMRTNLSSIEMKIGAFTDAVTQRLSTTTFPDDYFVKHLNGPIEQLKESSSALAIGINASLVEVTDSTKLIASALKKVKDKAGAAEGSLDTVLKLTQQQQGVLDASRTHNSTLEQLSITLKKIEETLTSTNTGVATSSSLTAELTSRIANAISDGAESRKALEMALSDVTNSIASQVKATNSMVGAVSAGNSAYIEANLSLTNSLNSSSAAAEATRTALISAANKSSEIIERLDSFGLADINAAQALTRLGNQATSALSGIDGLVEHVRGMTEQLLALDGALRERTHDSDEAKDNDLLKNSAQRKVENVLVENLLNSEKMPLQAISTFKPFPEDRTPASALGNWQMDRNDLKNESLPTYQSGKKHDVDPSEGHDAFSPASAFSSDQSFDTQLDSLERSELRKTVTGNPDEPANSSRPPGA